MLASAPFGQIDGRAVPLLTLQNGNLIVRVTPYGARLVQLWTPDRDGALADIVLGHDSVEEYRAATTYFGATCGRYANRIAQGRFMLDGVLHQLDVNEAPNHLHGGREGFDRKLWDFHEDAGAVVFSTVSADGEMGYPGEVTAKCRYELTADDRVMITMTARTTAPTVINLVNHAYFNLAGQGSGPVQAQDLRLAAPHYTPVGAGLIPTGAIAPVTGTPFDFIRARPIGDHGFDHNFCLPGEGMRDCAEARDPVSGRRLSLRTDQPGVQFYTGGYIPEGLAGKAGAVLGPCAGFTLETQKYPDSPNRPEFPSAVLLPGEDYLHRMEFAFSG
jgi:aldose 1-epimerase